MARKKAKPAPKKGGRKPILDAELVAAALVQLKGNISAVARRFKVDRSSVQELIGKRPALQQVLRDAREGRLDDAEDSLDRAVLEAQGWAVCFILKTLGKSRGYVERHEITGKDGDAIPVTFIEINRVGADRTEVEAGRQAGVEVQPPPRPGEGVG